MDADVVVRAQQGDEQAFASLAGHLYGRLRHVAVRILRDEDLAKDATQQAVLDMWRYLPKLRDPERFEAWAYRILANRCKREAKRRGHPEPAFAPSPVPDELAMVIDRDLLERGFRSLTVDQRTVLVLHHYVGLTVESIAEVLEIPTGTVQSRMARALARLRHVLHADMPHAPATAGGAGER
jgi:RNA polymerase sigma-70 factor (ECF subfamily)